MMAAVLANAGFLPIFQDYIAPIEIKIAEAQETRTVDNMGNPYTAADKERAQKAAQSISGYYNGQNKGGVYQKAYDTWTLGNGNTPEQAKAEANRIAQETYNEILPYAITVQNARSRGETAKAAEADKALADRLVEIENEKGILPAEDIAKAKAAAATEEAKKAREEERKRLDAEQTSEANIQSAVDNAPDQTTAGRNAAAAAEKKRQSEEAGDTPQGPINCGLGIKLLGGTDSNPESCVAIIAYQFLKLCALFLGIVGAFFNLTLNFTLNIGNYIPRTQPGDLGLGGPTGAIYLGWSTIRDFINVAFIFVLLFSAISIILQNDKYGLQKTVTKVVIAAMLLNFSLFFTKVVIDLSNILALQFYARILDMSKQRGADPTNIDAGLSTGLRKAIGLESLWSGTGTDTAKSYAATAGEKNDAVGPYQLIVISIFGGIFLLVFAFVLFMATIQFLIRTIVLIFLLITSPIGFLGGAIPGLENVSSDWLKRLKNNAIFAPAYMAIMYIACQMIFSKAEGAITGGSNLKSLFLLNDKGAAIGMAFWYAIVIGFLLAAQVGARKFADSFGSSFTGKAEKWFKSAPLLRYTGATAMARIGVGNAARVISESRIAKRLATTPGLKQIGGQALYNSIKNLQEVKVGGKSYKDVIEGRVKRDQTTFDRLGDTTVRRHYGESDDEFKRREVAAKNNATKARTRFMGLKADKFMGFGTNATNLKGGDDIKDKYGNVITKGGWFGRSKPLKELALSDAAFDTYKLGTEKETGSGYRKSRKELAKAASGATKKGSVEDIEKQIEKAKKNFDDNKDVLAADIALKKSRLEDPIVTNPNAALHQTMITSSDPAHEAYKVRWIAAKKQYDKAINEQDKKQEKMDDLYRKLRQAQNSTDKK